MNHPDEASLHDLVDGELSREERARIERHLADCSTCHSVVTDLRELREEARCVFGATAAQDALVPPDQWRRIEERLLSSPRIRKGTTGQHVRTRTPGFGFFPARILRQAATIALIVGASATTTWLLVRSGPSPGENAPPATDSPLVATGATASNRQTASLVVAAYQPAITDLERLLEEGRGRLLPETITILEENLRILDSAIADVEEALASDPAHLGGIRTLDGVLQAKLHLLREAVGLTRGA